MPLPATPVHPLTAMTRRAAIQAGAIGLLGLGMNHVSAGMSSILRMCFTRFAASFSRPVGTGRYCVWW